MKAIFIIEWKNGTPQMPELSEGMEVDSISADEHVTTNGVIKTIIKADEEVIEELKNYLEFVEYIHE